MIEIQNLRKSIAGRSIVNGVTLTVQKGSVFGFLGPNGAGKTTIIKMLVGLNTPESGSILIGNKKPSDAAVREEIGFMPEAPYFYDRLTGFEFLKLTNDLFHHKKRSEKECLTLLKEVGLAEASNEQIRNYSKGMKQRLGFAQAIVNHPNYLFLDEPLDGLDPIGRRELKAIIKRIKSEGTTVFFNSHILFDTEELCDEIGILNHGELLYSGNIHEFTQGKTLEEQFVFAIEREQSV